LNFQYIYGNGIVLAFSLEPTPDVNPVIRGIAMPIIVTDLILAILLVCLALAITTLG
jgi:hypothetical protein